MLFDQIFYEKAYRLSLHRKQRIGHFLASLSGEVHGRFPRACTGDFAGYRPYCPGDDIRLIDWNAYHKFNRAYIKLASKADPFPFYLLIDATKSMKSGEFNMWDYARKVAAVLAYLALRDELRVSIFLFCKRIRPLGATADRASDFPILCSRLAHAAADNAGSPFEALVDFSSLSIPRGYVTVISDFLEDRDLSEPLNELSQIHFSLNLIRLDDPSLDAVDGNKSWELIDIESHEAVPVFTSKETAENRKKYLKVFFESLLMACEKIGAGFQRYDTSIDLFEYFFCGESSLSPLSLGR